MLVVVRVPETVQVTKPARYRGCRKRITVAPVEARGRSVVISPGFRCRCHVSCVGLVVVAGSASVLGDLGWCGLGGSGWAVPRAQVVFAVVWSGLSAWGASGLVVAFFCNPAGPRARRSSLCSRRMLAGGEDFPGRCVVEGGSWVSVSDLRAAEPDSVVVALGGVQRKAESRMASDLWADSEIAVAGNVCAADVRRAARVGIVPPSALADIPGQPTGRGRRVSGGVAS